MNVAITNKVDTLEERIQNENKEDESNKDTKEIVVTITNETILPQTGEKDHFALSSVGLVIVSFSRIFVFSKS